MKTVKKRCRNYSLLITLHLQMIYAHKLQLSFAINYTTISAEQIAQT